MRNIILIAILIRFLTNIQTFSDYVYFLGRDILEAALMFVLARYTKGFVSHLLDFCIGLCLWNMIKPFFLDVTKHDYWEYTGVIAGLTIVIVKYFRYANKAGNS